jgi:hypothetical protein
MERSCGSLGGRSRSGSSSGGRHRTAAGGGKTPATAGKSPANSSDHLMASATTALEALVASWKQQPAAAAANSAAAPAAAAEQGVARALHFPEEPVSWWTGGSAVDSASSSWSNKTLENYFR